MKILLAYEHYPCSIARYIKRGLQALGHEVHSTGHSTGPGQAWPGEPQFPDLVDEPTYPVGNMANQYLIGDVTFFLAREYDLFINIDAAHWWSGHLPIPKVIVGTDPHCLNYDAQRQDCDLFVCMQNCYSRPGDVWLPYAYDEEWHYHDEKRATTLENDITFLGVVYQERAQDLELLRQAGLRVLSGTGIVFAEGSKIYSQGHLAYCRPSLLDLPARFFEAMAYGNIPLITHVPDLSLFPEFVEDWHYEVFREGNLVDMVKRTLADPRLEERKRSCREVIKPHTWANRASMLLEACQQKGLF